MLKEAAYTYAASNRNMTRVIPDWEGEYLVNVLHRTNPLVSIRFAAPQQPYKNLASPLSSSLIPPLSSLPAEKVHQKLLIRDCSLQYIKTRFLHK
jgi:hypothetical protein